jgi:hypothetical protein
VEIFQAASPIVTARPEKSVPSGAAFLTSARSTATPMLTTSGFPINKTRVKLKRQAPRHSAERHSTRMNNFFYFCPGPNVIKLFTALIYDFS